MAEAFIGSRDFHNQSAVQSWAGCLSVRSPRSSRAPQSVHRDAHDAYPRPPKSAACRKVRRGLLTALAANDHRFRLGPQCGHLTPRTPSFPVPIDPNEFTLSHLHHPVFPARGVGATLRLEIHAGCLVRGRFRRAVHAAFRLAECRRTNSETSGIRPARQVFDPRRSNF